MRLLIFLFAALSLRQAGAQERLNEGGAILVNLQYGGHLPAGDLADRFGGNFSAGGSVEHLTKNNFLFGVQSQLLFGNNVKEDVIAGLRNDDGLIFSDDFGLAEIRLRERGFYLDGHVGKIFPLSEGNKKSGIRISFGAGFLRHKIRIQDDPFMVVTQLNSDYKKGYDRLTNGLALTQFVGYHHLANNRLVNFMVGFEFTEAFTESRRSFNFDTRSKEEGSRLDLLLGFRIGWTLPFYIGENADEIQY